jgi:hypothetical protein
VVVEVVEVEAKLVEAESGSCLGRKAGADAFVV